MSNPSFLAFANECMSRSSLKSIVSSKPFSRTYLHRKAKRTIYIYIDTDNKKCATRSAPGERGGGRAGRVTCRSSQGRGEGWLFVLFPAGHATCTQPDCLQQVLSTCICMHKVIWGTGGGVHMCYDMTSLFSSRPCHHTSSTNFELYGRGTAAKVNKRNRWQSFADTSQNVLWSDKKIM